ncbi:MAG TPA: DUF2283 domain-containing protein [Trebonia sp.]|nr:DUF2283 domain-containing protein [Trebonia sp.]
MKLEYDLNAGALYIRLTGAAIARTAEAGDNAAVDLDADGGVVGIEVVSVAYPWPVAEVLATYRVPAREATEIRAYFSVDPYEHVAAEIRSYYPVRESPLQREPKLSTAVIAA